MHGYCTRFILFTTLFRLIVFIFARFAFFLQRRFDVIINATKYRSFLNKETTKEVKLIETKNETRKDSFEESSNFYKAVLSFLLKPIKIACLFSVSR